jgi:hypothetical protein
MQFLVALGVIFLWAVAPPIGLIVVAILAINGLGATLRGY